MWSKPYIVTSKDFQDRFYSLREACNVAVILSEGNADDVIVSCWKDGYSKFTYRYNNGRRIS